MRERLYKSPSDRMLSGVSGGLGEYLDMDSTLVRIAWVIVTIMSAGLGLLAYIVLVIIVPTRPPAMPGAIQGSPDGDALPDEGAGEGSGSHRPHVGAGDDGRKRRRNMVIGVVLVVIGGLALGYNLDLFEWLDWGKFWPALLILLGVLLIVRRFDRS